MLKNKIMSGKDLFMDFLSLLFLVVLIGFCIFYFIVGNRIGVVAEIMRIFAPLGFFGAILLIRLRLNQKEKKKRDEQSNSDIVIYLTFMDKLKSDLFLYSLPMLVIGLPMLSGYKIDTTIFLQACLVFVLSFFWQRFIFNKQR
jgi:hypothetical protein